jgi:hypothetical protein
MKSLLLIVTVVFTTYAQQYPRWFIEQDRIPCGTKIVSVMRAPSLYKDSAVALAFRTGCDLLAKYTAVNVRGGQAFWTTEAGVHSMGAHYVELYDSSLIDHYQSALKVIDAFVDKQKTIILAGDTAACGLDDDLRELIPITAVPRPAWVETLPNDNRYYYGVGTSEEYYYEPSSWQRAEHNAFMSLARSTRSTVVSLQKKNAVESHDLFNEDVDVQLKNVEITARWRDVQQKVFYVLARSKK